MPPVSAAGAMAHVLAVVSAAGRLRSLAQAGGAEITEVRSAAHEGGVAQVALKREFRELAERAEGARAAAKGNKRELDDAQLELDTRRFKKGRLGRAVADALAFTSDVSDADVGLVARDAFLKTERGKEAKVAAEKARKAAADATEGDAVYEHVIHLAALEGELADRKALVKQREAVHDTKLKLNAEVASEKRFLATMQETIKAIKEAAAPLKKWLEADAAGGAAAEEGEVLEDGEV